ncbi:MAG: beta-xylosidase [Anaerolineae bacterium]|nr:beta-xylosidase [Anaerolineae bacterium]
MQIHINPKQPGQPITPYWRVCVGGGRVGEALRADFQKHLELVQREMPFQYIRMHGLFHEDMMAYHEEKGRPIVNWQYVDLVYDHWLSIGIRPFVELGFMPYDLASGTETVFWWKGNITPPKDWERWEWFIEQYIRHVIERYGLDEVRQWYFEVWNEPSLHVFWKDADFDAYMELYARTARVLKRVDPQLRVGGPSSHGFGDAVGVPPWGKEFLAACAERDLPVDFFSTHPYPTRYPVDLEGRGYMTWDGPDRLLVDARGCDQLLRASAYPNIERHYTEWSSSPSPRDPVHDTAFETAFIVDNNWRARGLMDSLSFWVVSDIFEECRVGDTPFHGGFGLVNVQGLKKASYHGYWFLSRLGEEMLTEGDGYAVTRRSDGTLAVLLWNYCHYRADANDSRLLAAAKPGEIYELFNIQPSREFTLHLAGVGVSARVQTTRFDREYGSAYDAWVDMGAPLHILPADLDVLRRRMELAVSVQRIATPGNTLEWTVAVQPFGVTLLEIRSD